MASGTGNLPYPGKVYNPFDILTAEELNEDVANIEALATGSGIGDGALDTNTYKDGSVTPDKLLTGSPSDWDWIDYSATAVLTGWSSTTDKRFRYCIVGKICFIRVSIEGASNSTTSVITLPKTAGTNQSTPAQILNNGAWGVGAVVVSGSNLTLYTATLASLSSSGAKGVRVNLFYMMS